MSRAIAEVQTPGRRRRSEAKKAAILDAAEALFVAEGYERASVDAIAARAGVSKRTLYDHFGEKSAIFLQTLGRVNDAVTDTIRAAINEELTPGRDLRVALTSFAGRVVTQTFPSSNYLTFQRLTSQRWSTPQLPTDARNRPERMLEDCFAELAAAGALRAPDPGLASRHFAALTIGIALDMLDPGHGSRLDETETAKIINDGVDAFLRAYR